MKILTIDASTKCTGYAFFVENELIFYSHIKELKYKGKSKDRYPAKSAKCGYHMADKIHELILEHKPDVILIEEISIGGKQGTAQVKSLAALHGMILYKNIEYVDRIYFMPASGKMKSHGVDLKGWRTILGLKKSGDWKKSSMKMVKEKYGIEVENDDESDAILIGAAFLKAGIDVGEK